METVGVIGAGTMGGGIAHVAAAAGYEVLLCDISAALLESSLARISSSLEKAAGKGRITPAESTAILSRIKTHESLDALPGCGIVIEAVIEDAGVKRGLFARLGGILGPAAVIATNTSSLSITALASSVPRPERFLGLHFFNPPAAMKLVEVIRGEATSDAAYESALAFAKALGKVPVTAKDTPGFIVNRVARPFYGEALKILGEGVAEVPEIDRIVRSVGGFRMGPFELMDLIGIDVNLAVTRSVWEQTFGEPRYRPHVIQQRMVDSGRLGRKTGRGFYDYGGK